MQKYEYQFIAVPRSMGIKARRGDTFAACEQAIREAAAAGWQLKQIITEFDDKTGMYSPAGYRIVLERPADLA